MRKDKEKPFPSNHKSTEQASDKKTITSKKLIRIAGVVIFFFLISICSVLNFLNQFSDTWAGHFFVIKSEAADWFAFWGSFSGTLATVFVGYVTYRLTENIEENRIKSEKFEKKVTIVKSMPQMHCKEAKLFSFNRGDISSEHLKRFKNKNDFCLMLEMTPAFPPYFGVVISEIQAGVGDTNENTARLSREEYSFTNHQHFTLYINIPAEIEPAMEDFYLSYLAVTSATPHDKKNVRLRIRLQCGNTLLPDIEGNVEFDMILHLENIGKKAPGINLAVTNIQYLEIVDQGA